LPLVALPVSNSGTAGLRAVSEFSSNFCSGEKQPKRPFDYDLIFNSPSNCQYRRDRGNQAMSKSATRGEIVGGRGSSMFDARRGQSLWDTWNDPDGGDELAAAMSLLAVVRRDRSFSREVVRAFGMTRTGQRQRTTRGKSRRTGARRPRSH
jgi:hypothetical protein